MKKLLCVVPAPLPSYASWRKKVPATERVVRNCGLLLFAMLCCSIGARADGILLDSLSDSGNFGGGVNTSILPPLPVADSLQVSVGACLFNCGTPDLTSPTLNVLASASPIPVQDSLSPIPAGASNAQIFGSLTPQVFDIGPSDPNFSAVASSIEYGTATGWRVFLTPMSAAGQNIGGAGGGNTEALLPLYADITDFQVVVSPFEIANYTDTNEETDSDYLVPIYTVTTNIFGIPNAAPPPPPPPVPPVNAATPEPAPILLMLLGMSVILFLTRRRLIMRIPRTA